jgi:hypothetical protein
MASSEYPISLSGSPIANPGTKQVSGTSSSIALFVVDVRSTRCRHTCSRAAFESMGRTGCCAWRRSQYVRHYAGHLWLGHPVQTANSFDIQQQCQSSTVHRMGSYTPPLRQALTLYAPSGCPTLFILVILGWFWFGAPSCP